jgi:hypothetical protein
MKSIESDIERVKRRSTVKNQKLFTTLDTLTNELDSLICQLEETESKNSPIDKNIEEVTLEKKVSCSSDSIQSTISKIIRHSCKRIVDLKSIVTIKTNHKEYFTYISKLGKTIDKTLIPIPKEIRFDFIGVHRELCSLVEGHHNELSKQPKPESPQAKSLNLYEQLEKKLSQKDVCEALAFYENHQTTLKLIDSEFKSNLCKIGFLSLANEGKLVEAIFFLRKKNTATSIQLAEEVGELIHSVCYPKDLAPPKRLSISHDFETILLKCIKQVRRAIRRIKGLPEISTFMQLMNSGLIALPQHITHKEIWMELIDEEEIQVNIDLPKEMIHHSMIYCPISKDVCDPIVNIPLLQNCGHIVGQSSVKKMVDTSRGRNLVGAVHFKCPTCPNQQTQVSMKPILY